jgi:sialic acid synthase SpsE
MENFKPARRSVAAKVDIPADAPIKADWLTGLRPLWGIPVEETPRVIGKRLTRAVAAGDIIKDEDLAR